MCGRYVAARPMSELAAEFHVDDVRAEDHGQRFNVAPTDPVYAVATSKDGTRRLGTFKWGLVPFWAKDPKVASRMINARVETLAQKHRRTLSRRRCIIPADGFYEWQDREGKRPKQPFYIHDRAGGTLAFAGLWEVWHDPENPDAEPLRTCTIITTDANQVVARTHDRMPVILSPAAWDAWLDPTIDDLDVVQGLLVAEADPADTLEVYPVNTDVNSVKNDGPQLILPLEGHDPQA
jgi:putative SOS response-associated peptidase YedK